MRWPVPVLLLLLAAASGCIDGSAQLLDRQCPRTGSSLVQQEHEMLLPKGTPEQAVEAAGGHAHLTVDALEGQTISASAVWQVDGGKARAVLDGVDGGVTSMTDHTYSWTGKVAAGTYTLEVVGDPVAAGSIVILSLVAMGCPSP